MDFLLWLFGVPAAFCALRAAYFLLQNYQIRQTCYLTEGKVIELRKDEYGRQYPVIAFKDARGKAYRYLTRMRLALSAYQPGDTVPLWYKPSKPEQVQLSDFWGSWLAPLLWGLLAVLLAGLGGLTYWADLA